MVGLRRVVAAVGRSPGLFYGGDHRAVWHTICPRVGYIRCDAFSCEGADLHPLPTSITMKNPASTPFRAAVQPSSRSLPLRILQVAGGDHAFALQIREMMWQAYCDVDCPFGPSEEGMFLWFEHEAQVR